MKLHLIEPNYVYKHKYFNIIKVIGGIYMLLLLRYTTYNSDNSFLISVKELEMISALFMFLIFIILLLNSILYIKVGELCIDKNTIKLLKNEWTKTIYLKNIKSIQIQKVHGKEYVLKIDKVKIPIELNTSELNALKRLNTVTKINFEKISIFNKLKNSILNFSHRNKAFVDDVSRK